MAFEEDLLRDAEDDARTVAYIQTYLPSELKEKFDEDVLYYFHDLIGEYIVDLLEKSDNEEEIDIDVEACAAYLVKQAKKEKIGDFDVEDVRWVVDGELEFADQAEED